MNFEKKSIETIKEMDKQLTPRLKELFLANVLAEVYQMGHPWEKKEQAD